MIDYWSVLANSLWILGLATVLATLSLAHWRASVERAHFRAVLARRSMRQALDFGLFLFCAGLAATGETWFERVLWGLLATVWAVQLCLAAREPTGE